MKREMKTVFPEVQAGQGNGRGSDMPGISHPGRLLPPWKGQGEKVILPDYGESDSQLYGGKSSDRAVAKREPAMSGKGQPVSPLAHHSVLQPLL